MTGRQMQIAFQDVFNRANVPLPLTSTELFKELNDAQDIVIEQIYNQFEEDYTALSALVPLIERGKTISTTGIVDPTLEGFIGDFAVLPADFRFLVAMRATVDWVYGGYTDFNFDLAIETGILTKTVNDVSKVTSTRPMRIVQQDDLYKMLQDPFNTTKYKSPIAVVHDNHIDAYTDDFSFIVTAVVLDYIRDPAQIAIGTDSELPEFVHQRIVDLAVDRNLQRMGLTQEQPTS